jgi:hypothetical protein
MKHLSFLILGLIFFFASCQNEKPVAMAFAKYSSHDGVTSITVPGFLISLASKISSIPEEERELLQGMSKVKILTIDNPELNRKVNFHEEFYAMLSKGKYEELLRISDPGNDVTIMGIMDDDFTIREMVILVGGDDNAMIYVKGKLHPEMINKLAFNSPDTRSKMFGFLN